MKPITVCVPVLKRYDLLARLLDSLRQSTLRPVSVCILDNGRNYDRVKEAICGGGFEFDVLTPNEPMGVAASWNWFAKNIEEERVIVNDDVTFAAESLAMLVSTPGGIVSGLLPTNAFSCFVLRDWLYALIGAFDEGISPGYAYFEDCDYQARMLQCGLDIVGVDCGVSHVGSATLQSRSASEVDEHNKRFLIAQSNYINKWGRLPHGMQVQY